MQENQLQTVQAAENQEVEINLLELLLEWRRHIVVIVLAGILGALLGFGYTQFFVTPRYQASSTMYIVSATANSALDLSDLSLGTTLSEDYVELMTSRNMLERVIKATGDPLTPSQLRGMVSVKKMATRILSFTVSSTNPQQAARLADAFVDQGVLFLQDVMSIRDNLPQPIDYSVVPGAPYNMSYTGTMVKGCLICVVLALAFYTVLFILNDTFNSADDVEKILGLVPLAVVPENGQKHKGRNYGYGKYGYGYYYSNSGKKEHKE